MGSRSIFRPARRSRSSPPFRRRVRRQYGGSVRSSEGRRPPSARAITSGLRASPVTTTALRLSLPRARESATRRRSQLEADASSERRSVVEVRDLSADEQSTQSYPRSHPDVDPGNVALEEEPRADEAVDVDLRHVDPQLEVQRDAGGDVRRGGQEEAWLQAELESRRHPPERVQPEAEDSEARGLGPVVRSRAEVELLRLGRSGGQGQRSQEPQEQPPPSSVCHDASIRPGTRELGPRCGLGNLHPAPHAPSGLRACCRKNLTLPPCSTPRPPGSIRPWLALAADPIVARQLRDPSPAPSSLLGLGRDRGATIRSIQLVSAFVSPSSLSSCPLAPVRRRTPFTRPPGRTSTR